MSYLVDIASPFFSNVIFSGKKNAPNSSSTPILKDSIDVDDVVVYRADDAESLQIESLFSRLDRPFSQILVKAFVYEVSTTKSEGSAVNLALNILKGKIGLSLNDAKVLPNSVSFQNNNLTAIFSALSSDSRFKVLSSPSLRVRSGQSAQLRVGQDVPVMGNASVDRLGNPVQSVDYKTSGVILDLKPVVRESVIDLSIIQEISNFVQTTTGVNNSPTLTKRSISTSVSAFDGEIVVLGGLDEDKDTHDSQGVFFLPDFLHSGSLLHSHSEILMVFQVQRI